MARERHQPANVSGSIAYMNTQTQWFNTIAVFETSGCPWGNLTRVRPAGRVANNWNVVAFKSFELSESRGSHIECVSRA